MKAEFIAGNVNMRNFTAPYTFVEYPKHVTLADGSYVVVNNAEEEAAAVGEEGDLRDALMAEARALGLDPHHRTGAEKLKQMIEQSKEQS
ncbi:hypothetical protein [Paraburkholderia sacchari]|uniref:hypothetical protein n=1 Tax=Paraburkholderia sacchari TaxID=159450 RepID=UPI003D96E58C